MGNTVSYMLAHDKCYTSSELLKDICEIIRLLDCLGNGCTFTFRITVHASLLLRPLVPDKKALKDGAITVFPNQNCFFFGGKTCKTVQEWESCQASNHVSGKGASKMKGLFTKQQIQNTFTV